MNPIGDGGASLKEALHGLRNLYELAQRTGRRIAVTHKIVISRLNYRDLDRIFQATYRFGVRNFILQPVKVSGLDAGLGPRLAINEDEFMPYVNDLLRRTEGSGAEIKLYGMSQLGALEASHVAQETNLIRHVDSKRSRRTLDLYQGDRLIPEATAASTALLHRVTVRLPTSDESATFECGEDQFILNAALAAGLGLPFGCRMGSCGACSGRVVEGRVERVEQLVLRRRPDRVGVRAAVQVAAALGRRHPHAPGAGAGVVKGGPPRCWLEGFSGEYGARARSRGSERRFCCSS